MFNNLIGNDSVKEFLRRLERNGRVPNALLFAGPEGVGKKLFALALAKYFACRSIENGEACGTCANCKRVDVFKLPKSEKGEDYERVFFSEHPDVGQVIPYKNNVRVDAVRDLEREACFRPYEADSRFFIIDDAHKLKDAAANALLKTLEEPAPTSHIILVTSRPDTLLQTIRSRCQVIRFAPVAPVEIENLLLSTQKFSHEDAKLAAALSSGSVGQALLMDIQKYRALRESMLGVFENAAGGRDRASLLRAAEQMNDARNKDDFESTLGILESLIRDAWLVKNGAGVDAVSNRDLAGKIADVSEGVDSHILSSWLSGIEELRESFAVNINRKVAADALFMRMAG